MIFFKLTKAGYGTLAEVREFDSRTVLQAMCYEKFLDDYETAYMETDK